MVSWIAGTSAHTCTGTILNTTNMTFTLAVSSIVTGTLTTSPAVNLQPYAATTFVAESTSTLNDRINYQFAYTPMEAWCSGNTTSGLTVSGGYAYTYGDNDCYGDQVDCVSMPSGYYMQLNYENCDGVWDTSAPSFTILYGKNY